MHPTKVTQSSPKVETLQSRILSGSLILLSGIGFVAVLNFAYNIAIARLLGPADFGHATAIYTILFLLSSVTLSFQLVGAKVAARPGAPEARDAAYRDYHRSAWMFGIVCALILILFSRGIADYLRVPGPMLIVLISVGVAFYIPLGSRRGYVQGACSFRLFAWNMVVENGIRLVGAVFAILIGTGVTGVIVANSVAVVVAYFALNPKVGAVGNSSLNFSAASSELITALIFFAGVGIINNSGIVLVKHYFPAIEAGLYAAVAMVGRVIFSFATAVVNSTFPIVAGTAREDRKSPKIVITSLVLVLAIGAAFTFGLWVTPKSVWSIFLGHGFEIGGANRLSYLMPLCAIMTTIYSLSTVLITYEMAYKVAKASWIQLGFSGLVVAAICLMHGSLRQVIYVQTALMVVLFVVVGVPFLINFVREEHREAAGHPLRKIRRVAEAEVMGEFLRNDFDLSLYRDYQDSLGKLVQRPDYESDRDNALRRALLFLRHRPLWAQLPADTEWYEVALEQEDLANILVFPRAQWARLTGRDFHIERAIRRLRSRAGKADESFRARIATLQRELVRGGSDPFGCVLLLASDQNGPFTILDGNHRLVAAALEPPLQVERLRFYLGISPRMTRCCWCRTNFFTLTRYAISRMILATHNSHAELEDLLRTRNLDPPPPQRPASSKWESVKSNFSEPEEDAAMANQIPAISVIEAPDHAGNGKEQRAFLKSIESQMQASRPRIVLDCSRVRKFDKPFVHLLLCCLEEAMKRNGDVRLAGIPPEARTILDENGATSLFELFGSTEEARNSYAAAGQNELRHAAEPRHSQVFDDLAPLPQVEGTTMTKRSVNR